MSYLVGNLEDRFSRGEAHLEQELSCLFSSKFNGALSRENLSLGFVTS